MIAERTANTSIMKLEGIDMSKHTKLFFRTIARIRAVGNKNSYVFIIRIKTRFHTGYVRAARLWEELIKAGVLREWDKNDFKKSPVGGEKKGNILWENLGKYHKSFLILIFSRILEYSK